MSIPNPPSDSELSTRERDSPPLRSSLLGPAPPRGSFLSPTTLSTSRVYLGETSSHLPELYGGTLPLQLVQFHPCRPTREGHMNRQPHGTRSKTVHARRVYGVFTRTCMRKECRRCNNLGSAKFPESPLVRGACRAVSCALQGESCLHPIPNPYTQVYTQKTSWRKNS
jgi:hypothetical protein